MALKKTRTVISDNGDKAQTIFEHNLVRMGVPILGVLLLSIVSWLFTTVLELDERVQQNIIHIEHLHMAEEKFEDQLSKMQEKMTDVRVHVGRLTAH